VNKRFSNVSSKALVKEILTNIFSFFFLFYFITSEDTYRDAKQREKNIYDSAGTWWNARQTKTTLREKKKLDG
jgi:hypothetical protein